MSRVLDFRDLRERVLAGEEPEEVAEPEDTPFSMEVKDKPTILALCLSVGSLSILGFDRFQNEGQMFSHYAPLVFSFGGILPLGFALGRLNRGLSAQKTNQQYDRLLDEADAKIEEMEEEAQEAEEAKEAEAQAEAESQSYHFDYLSAENSSYHEPTIGFGLSAFGQEGVMYRPPSDALW